MKTLVMTDGVALKSSNVNKTSKCDVSRRQLLLALRRHKHPWLLQAACRRPHAATTSHSCAFYHPIRGRQYHFAHIYRY
jgi:hypothetical protein